MAWTWRYVTSAGEPVPEGDDRLVRPAFPTQGDAETWIGETWSDLLEAGVDAVVLLEDGREVYGPMSLHPAGES